MTYTRIVPLALLVSLPLAAQQRDSAKPAPGGPPAGMRHEHMGPGMGMGGMGGMGGGMMMGDSGMQAIMGQMMAMMAYSPGRLLAHKDSLKLTADQVTKLTSLQTIAQAAHRAAMDAARPHVQAGRDAMMSGDTAGMRAHMMEGHSAMANAHITQISFAMQAKAVLTPEQQATVDKWSKDMMGGGMMMQHEHQMGPPHNR